MKDWNHETSRSVDNVIGAFMLIKAEVFETVGVFDEDFFVFLEDLDLATRARKHGWDVYYSTSGCTKLSKSNIL